jgi:hypothetical protein
MRAPLLFTIEETVHALRIARAAKEYVRRSEELAELLVKSEKPLDPKIELRTGEAWARLLEAVKARPKTGPPLTKKGRASKHGPKLLNSLSLHCLLWPVKRAHVCAKRRWLATCAGAGRLLSAETK